MRPSNPEGWPLGRGRRAGAVRESMPLGYDQRYGRAQGQADPPKGAAGATQIHPDQHPDRTHLRGGAPEGRENSPLLQREERPEAGIRRSTAAQRTLATGADV